MSKGRMQDLRDALGESGFVVLNEQEKERYPGSIYVPDDEVFLWRVEHEETGRQFGLEFYIFGELGAKSILTSDILYCKIEGQPEKLYFEKRQSLQWSKNVDEFIRILIQKCSET